ncbi:MAG: ferritin family protein [Chloroflexi bacterium]|nr:ferritin family protein [Chloroflexota bacterium]MBU1746136.1 ferritin family protein [Chloroflexota bacterium]
MDMQIAETILSLAIQTEIDGYEFYIQAAQRTADPGGQRLFRSLAADEVEHRRILEDQLRSVQAEEGWLAHAELAAPVERTAIFQPERLQQDVNAYTAELSALRMAMLIEADAVTFYSKAADQVGDEQARKLFLDLVRMEEGHRTALQREYDFLMEQFRNVMGFAPF